MKLRFDEDRARWLFRTLTDLWTRKAGVYEGVVLPQDRWPLPEDPTQKANKLLFTAITQRGGIVSEDPFRYLLALEAKHPDLFDPQAVVANWTPKTIQRALRKVILERKWKDGGKKKKRKKRPPEQLFFDPIANGNGNGDGKKKRGMYKIHEFATSWHRNAVTLATRFDCNILKAYKDVKDFEEFFARVDYKRNEYGIHGMRRKILSLLTIWLQEKELVPIFPTPIPVDFHAQRLLFVTGAVVPEEVDPFVVKPGTHPPRFEGRAYVLVTEELMDEIAIWSMKFMPENGFSHMVINPALWVLSRELCPNEFQHKSTGRREKMHIHYPEDLEARPGKWPHPYADPAPICPLASMCTKVMPWAPYYDFGRAALDRRVPYPHPRLSLGITPRGGFSRKRNERII